jgi:hypothetical protein
MKGPKTTPLSRRTVVTASGVAGLALVTPATTNANAGATELSEQVSSLLDVSDPVETLHMRARLLGNLDPNGRRIDRFEGVVMGITPAGDAVTLVGLCGQIETRFVPTKYNNVWQRTRTITGAYNENTTGELLTRFLNPFTGESVAVPDLWAEADDFVDGTQAPDWRQEQSQLVMEDTETFNHFGAPMVSMTVRVAHLKDLGDASLSAVPTLGTWTLSGPWPDWLQMDNMPGQCVIRCSFSGDQASV